MEDPKAMTDVDVQLNEDLELLFGRGLPLRVHELQDLVGDVEEVDGTEGLGKGIVGGKGVAKALLTIGPMKEVDGNDRVE